MQGFKEIRFVLYLSDVDDLNFTKDDRDTLDRRLTQKFSYGTNFPEAICVYPHIIAETHKTEEAIITKLNYTVAHEIIHCLIGEVGFSHNEEVAHGLTMILNEDQKNNLSGQGFNFYDLFNAKIEVNVKDEEETEKEGKIMTEQPKQTCFVAQTTEEARSASIRRLANKRERTGL